MSCEPARSAPSFSSVLRVAVMELVAASVTSSIPGPTMGYHGLTNHGLIRVCVTALFCQVVSVCFVVSHARKNNKKNRRIMRTLQTRPLLKANRARHSCP